MRGGRDDLMKYKGSGNVERYLVKLGLRLQEEC